MILSNTAGSNANPLLFICISLILVLVIFSFTAGESDAANVSGTVYYSTTAVADIPLTLWDPQANIRLTTSSDSDGHYFFNNVPAGHYQLWSDFPQDDPLGLTYWSRLFIYDIGETDLSIDYYLWKIMKINNADPFSGGPQTVTTPYPTFCWSGLPESANYRISISSNVAPSATIERAYPISETCYTMQQALDSDQQYDTQVFAYDQNDEVIGFGNFLFDVHTYITFSEYRPTPNSAIQQEVNPFNFLNLKGWINAIDCWMQGNSTKGLNTFQSSLARLNLQPIVHSAVLCSKDSDIDWDSIRVFVNGNDVTGEAGIYPWPANTDCASRGAVVFNKYWIDENVNVRVDASTMDGASGSGRWNFSVDTPWLWGKTKPAVRKIILKQLDPFIDTLETLFLPEPVLGP